VNSGFPSLPFGDVLNELNALQKVLQLNSSSPVQSSTIFCEGVHGSFTDWVTRKSGILTFFTAERAGNLFLSDDKLTSGQYIWTWHWRDAAHSDAGYPNASWNYTVNTLTGYQATRSDIKHRVSGLGEGSPQTFENADIQGPINMVHDYFYTKEHTNLKSLNNLGSGKYELLVEMADKTNFRFTKWGMTFLINKSFASATAEGRNCTTGSGWITVSPDVLIGGPLDLKWEKPVEMTSPDTQTYNLLVENNGNAVVDGITLSLHHANNGATISHSQGPFTLSPGASKSIPLSIQNPLADYENFAYGLKSLNLGVNYSYQGINTKVIKSMDMHVLPLLLANILPFANAVASPNGKNFFSFNLHRKPTWEGGGRNKGQEAFPTYVIPTASKTTGHIEVNIAGPFKGSPTSIPFSMDKDEVLNFPLVVQNTDPNDDSNSEIQLRFFIDGVGEISQLHPPISIKVNKDILLTPHNDQGLLLFFDYEHNDGEPVQSTIQVNPKTSVKTEPDFGGVGYSEYTDGVFGKALKNGTGQWIYLNGEINQDSGSIVWWMRLTYDMANTFQVIYHYEGGHMTAGAAGPYDNNESWGMVSDGDWNPGFRIYMAMANGQVKTIQIDQPAPSTYHHYSMVWNIPRRIYRVYIDGKVVGEADSKDETVPWLPAPSYNPAKSNSFGFSKYSRGTDKDQVAWFSRNLSVKEIQDIMANGIDTSSGKAADVSNPDNNIPIDSAFLNNPSGIIHALKEGNEFSFKIFPNPFNPNAKITVYNPGIWSGKIAISVYDLKGKLIESFQGPAGTEKSSFSWNAKSLPSGTYFLIAKMGSKWFKQKVVLMK